LAQTGTNRSSLSGFGEVIPRINQRIDRLSADLHEYGNDTALPEFRQKLSANDERNLSFTPEALRAIDV